MLRALIATVISVVLLVPSASAQESVTIWLDSQIPEDKLIVKADNLTGGGTHLAHVDLAFPPMPLSKEDDLKYEALRTAIADGKTRWDEFEIELPIATELEGVIFTIDVIRDKRDLQDMTDARLFQGAAASKAFEPDEFLEDERALPFRAQLPGMRVNNPWLQAMALDQNREFTKADIADGSAYPELVSQQLKILGLADGGIDLTGVPEGATVVIDGREVGEDTEVYAVRAGVHYTHVLRNDVISGRQRVEVEPGETVDLPLTVDSTELDQARAKLLEGTTTGLPKSVKKTIDQLMRNYDGSVFLAAVDREKNKIEVLPYAREAKLVPQRLVTVVAAAEIGGGLFVSKITEEKPGQPNTGPGVHAGIQVEIGVSYGALLLGGDVALSPTMTTSHANPNEDATSNVNALVLPSPYGGLGVYVLRPTGDTPTLLLAGTYGWNYPAHMTVGGRLIFGIPVDDGTWFRINVGMKQAAKAMDNCKGEDGCISWDDWLDGAPSEHFEAFARLGFGTRF